MEMEKPFYFYFIYLIFCQFNTDSSFIFSSLLISHAAEGSWSQSKVEKKRVLLRDSALTVTGDAPSEEV